MSDPKKKDQADGIYIHELDEPMTWEGKTYERFEFKFLDLTGQDGIDVEQEINEEQGTVLFIPEMTPEYQLRIAARAAGLNDCTVLKQLTLKDTMAIRRSARRFLTDM